MIDGSGKDEGLGRAGTQTLSLLAIPFTLTLLLDLAEQPRTLADLRRKAGAPPQTTMRGHLRALAAIGVVEKHREGGFGGSVDYRLTAGGRELLVVARELVTWVSSSREEPMAFGSDAARSAIKALIEAWATGMLRALAARPLSLTELDRVIGELSYPALARRLTTMRTLGLVVAAEAEGRSTPYTASDWLRRGFAPLAAAIRWERRRLAEKAPDLTNRDVEALFLLPLPLLRLPAEVSGTCRFAVQVGGDRRAGAAGAVALIRRGCVAAMGTRLEDRTDAWALGRVGPWLSALIDGELDGIEFGGRASLAAEVVEGLHRELFGPADSDEPEELSAPVSRG